MRPLTFLGDSLDRIREFPPDAQSVTGFQLNRIQRRMEPADWKPMPTIGAGVRELRIRESSGAFRIIYLTTLPNAVYVLHAFRKTTQKTEKRDIELASIRLRDLLRDKK